MKRLKFLFPWDLIVAPFLADMLLKKDDCEVRTLNVQTGLYKQKDSTTLTRWLPDFAFTLS